jgi:hypothetical protein
MNLYEKTLYMEVTFRIQWLAPHLANRRLGFGSSNLGTSVMSWHLSHGMLGFLALVGNQF